MNKGKFSHHWILSHFLCTFVFRSQCSTNGHNYLWNMIKFGWNIFFYAISQILCSTFIQILLNNFPCHSTHFPCKTFQFSTQSNQQQGYIRIFPVVSEFLALFGGEASFFVKKSSQFFIEFTMIRNKNYILYQTSPVMIDTRSPLE